ncbi:MAG: hypothetical protein R2776_01515 [Flavobacteriaceae bacterium]|nr:hypothetical protein [Flavobacteriaceae bacterium]
MNAPKILCTLLLITNTLFAQTETYTYDTKGLHPEYLVVPMEAMTQTALYKKALSWAKTDTRTVVSEEANEKIVFQGEKENAMCFTVMGKKSCNALRYQVEVAFKEGKYKFEVISLEQYGPINDTGKKGWFPVALDKAPDAFYTRGGDLKKEYVETPNNIASLFNELNAAFKKGLLKVNEKATEEGW